MSIRGTLRATGTQIYMGGQIVTTGTTYYGVNGTAQTDLAVIQQAITAAGVNLTPQQVIAAGGVDEYAVGSININVATSAVTDAIRYYAAQTPAPAAPAAPAPSGSSGTTGSGSGGSTSGPYAPYTPYTPPAAPAPVTAAPPPIPAYTPTSSAPPASSAPAPAASYGLVTNSQPPGGIYSDSFDTLLPSGTTNGTTAPAPAGLMTTLSTLPWYYWAGGAAAALLLFSGSGSRR